MEARLMGVFRQHRNVVRKPLYDGTAGIWGHGYPGREVVCRRVGIVESVLKVSAQSGGDVVFPRERPQKAAPAKIVQFAPQRETSESAASQYHARRLLAEPASEYG